MNLEKHRCKRREIQNVNNAHVHTNTHMNYNAHSLFIKKKSRKIVSVCTCMVCRNKYLHL
jgi:hypothetical protein